uniref:Uncharacterized protein n=1 Tax=Micrurus surinamensis TaxID=129470 RepID=A0A2D4P747_MICSU
MLPSSHAHFTGYFQREIDNRKYTEVTLHTKTIIQATHEGKTKHYRVCFFSFHCSLLSKPEQIIWRFIPLCARTVYLYQLDLIKAEVKSCNIHWGKRSISAGMQV